MRKKRWVSIIEYFKKDEFAKHGGIMFIAGAIAGAISYVYQIYMGRILGPEEYGILGSLFAIFYMISIISQTLCMSTTNFVSKFVGEGKQIGFFIKNSLKHMILLGFLISIIFLILREKLMYILKLTDIGPVLILILILFLAWIVPMTDGTLRGVKRFTVLGFTGMLNAFCKLIFGISLVLLGFGISGALFGVALGMLFALIVSFIFIRPYIRPNNPHEPDFRFSSFYFYSIPVMVAMINYSVPTNLDVILVKYLFSAIDAGLYTSASILGKIVFFFPGAIGTVMFPMVVEKHVRGENTKDLLKRSLFYTGLIAGLVVLIYILVPDLIIKIFGDKYTSAIPLVVPYGLTMFLFSLIVVIMNYHLAIKNMRYIALFTGFTILEIFLLLTFHSSILEIIQILSIVSFIFLSGSLFYTWRLTQ